MEVMLFFIGLLFGVFLVYFLKSSHIRGLKQERDDFIFSIKQLRKDNEQLLVELTRSKSALESEKRMAHERETMLLQMKARTEETFKALSHDALKENANSFLGMARSILEEQRSKAEKDLNHYRQLTKLELDQRNKDVMSALQPVQEGMKKFEDKVGQLDQTHIAVTASLREQLRSLGDSQVKLNKQTDQLVNALKTPRIAGHWGEMQLKRVVEISGMIAHCDFNEQTHISNDQGIFRPDMTIKLPGGKSIIVDAKTPLQAFLSAHAADNEQAKHELLEEHALRLKKHVQELGKKRYWDQFSDSPDFVVLFLPGEQFFHSALEVNPALIEEGMDSGVIIATPVSLLALLRAVAIGWQQQALADNAQQIAKLGKDLYDRIGVLAKHWASVGKGLEDATKAYNQSVGAFQNRVLVSARRFRDLQVSSDPFSKEPQQVLSSPRSLQLNELNVFSLDELSDNQEK